MRHIEHWTVDVLRFKEAVWAVERENFRPGDAVDALERARVDVDSAEQLRGAVDALREAIEAARLFNRSGMTWSEYDTLLARLEHDHLGGQ